MDLDRVRQSVEGIPHMDAHQGALIYEHVRKTKPSLILELGTANGVSAAYMTAALEENGSGRMISVDIDRAHYVPGPIKLFEGLSNLRQLVEFRRVPDSSYVWMLRGEVAQQSDAAGNCTPLYDFVFIDGAHEFTIDGLAAVLVSRLLKPDGWLLLDDLDWCHTAEHPPEGLSLSREQLETYNVREVFEVLVKPDPTYTEFLEQDGNWGWAHKGSGNQRTLQIAVSENLGSTAIRKAKSAWRKWRR
jgi:predicted O-methyltransferase YrrM